VFSPLRTTGRLAPLMLKHKLPELRDLNGMPFRTCRPDEEKGSDRVRRDPPAPSAATARRRATVDQIAAQYDVTTDGTIPVQLDWSYQAGRGTYATVRSPRHNRAHERA
jgi:hypothetical protein